MSSLHGRGKDLARSRTAQSDSPPGSPSLTARTLRVSGPPSVRGLLGAGCEAGPRGSVRAEGIQGVWKQPGRRRPHQELFCRRFLFLILNGLLGESGLECMTQLLPSSFSASLVKRLTGRV